MMEILPIKSLTDQDSLIFGQLSVALGKLARADFPVGNGIVVSAPEFKLKTILEHFNFDKKEVFEQSLSLVKKELASIPVPEILQEETGHHKKFFLNKEVFKSTKDLWQKLLNVWLEEVKTRIWQDGFYPGITQNLSSQVVIFIKKIESQGVVFFDPLQWDSVINIKFGKLHPNDLKKLDNIVRLANKKLFIPHEYEWTYDHGIKLVGLKPYTPVTPAYSSQTRFVPGRQTGTVKPRSTVKVFLDLSSGMVIEKDVDGIYIDSGKILDLDKPRDSFDHLIFRIVEASLAFHPSPILVKLSDKSEGMGKIRGALRLIHQKSLLNPLIDALDFVRHKKGLMNVHIGIPFIRNVSELIKIKRELAVKKLMRKNSLQIWMEASLPENILNLEDYLTAGLDGIILNLDELISYLNGFDNTQQELTSYKNEVKGLLKFLEDSLKLLHKSKIPFIALGSLNLYPEVLEYLIEKGVYGLILEKYETQGVHELLHQAEKRLILRSNPRG
ncbi:hypothetical protein HYW41_02775 [Candidatus Daviesbacteria bacterium]|nr:hypothetical protein [Candidatus Daviesbacteria bacterium]